MIRRYGHKVLLSPLAAIVGIALLFGVDLGPNAGPGSNSAASRSVRGETSRADEALGHWKRVSKPMQWTLPRDPNGARLEISAHPEICIGRPEPRFGAIRVSGLKRAVIITARVIVFRRVAKRQTCMGVGGGIAKVLVLPAPVGSRALYDVSTDPPTRRWPR